MLLEPIYGKTKQTFWLIQCFFFFLSSTRGEIRFRWRTHCREIPFGIRSLILQNQTTSFWERDLWKEPASLFWKKVVEELKDQVLRSGHMVVMHLGGLFQESMVDVGNHLISIMWVPFLFPKALKCWTSEIKSKQNIPRDTEVKNNLTIARGEGGRDSGEKEFQELA